MKFNRSWRRTLRSGDRRLWLLGCVALRIERAAIPVWRFEIYHRRLLLTATVCAVVGYLTATTALWFWLDRNPHNQARWFDVVQLPWKWDQLRARRGDTAIATARERLQQGDYVEAFHYLRTGLGRSPGNVEGRLLYAQMLAGYEPARALAVMEAGIPFCRDDLRFVSALFAFYAMQGAYERAATQLDALSPSPGAKDADEIIGLIARMRAELLSRQDKFDEALAALPAAASPMRARLLLRAGRATDARDEVARLDRNNASGAMAELARLEGDIAIALGDADALRRVLIRWRAAEPTSPPPYLYGFEAWHRLGRPSLRDSAEREFFQLFGGNDAAMQSFAALAVVLDLPDVVERARQVAVARRASGFAYRVHRTEIALRRKEFELAVRHLQEWERLIETLPPPQRFHPEFIRRLARQAFSGEDTTADQLVAHLTGNRGQAQLPVWQFAARTLEQAGDLDALRKLLRPARILYPHTDDFRAVEKDLAASEIAVAPVLAAPSSPVVEGTPEQLLARMDEHLAAESLAAARDLVRAVRARHPGGLGALEPDWARRELQLGMATQDSVTQRALVRRYLERHRAPADVLPLVEWARELRDDQRLAEARIVAEEVNAASDDLGVGTAVAALKLPDDLADDLASLASTLRALDAAIGGSRWTEAERLLTALRQRPPSWVGENPPELKVREIQARLGMAQRPQALASLKDLVIRSGAPRSAAFQLVREYAAAGEQESAVYLAREIVRLLPGDAAAEKLLQEARAPRPTVAGE